MCHCPTEAVTLFFRNFVDMSTESENKRFGAGTSRKQVVLVVALVLLAWGAWYVSGLFTGYDGSAATWVHIPRKASQQEATDSIVSALGEKFGGKVAALWSGNVDASKGAYLIEPGEEAWAVAKKIGRGQQTPIRITFNNLRLFEQLEDKLAGCLDFTKEEFEDAVTKTITEESISREKFEAQFLPDTYEVYWTATPNDIIKKIRRYYAKFWDEERSAKAKALGLSELQVSVLASIVEEESNRRDEHKKIARLYLNRLHRGMLLQADPTVKFATGDFAARRITRDMLNVESAYNTYKVAGLPPGIIRLPAATTLDAVLNAPKHNYIYMCARPDGSGYHDFTADYNEHLRNANAYRKATYSKK